MKKLRACLREQRKNYDGLLFAKPTGRFEGVFFYG